jgi:uncharacterized protein
MQINQDRDPTHFSIRGYSEESITIIPPADGSGGSVALEQLSRNFLMTPTRLLRDWGPERIDELNGHPEHLADLYDIRPEVLLLGTGGRLRFPAPALMAQLHEQGIGVEFMDNAAACRTFNILMAEGRDVAIAVFFD